VIESGSHVPGVDPAAFGLPPHTALRIELPSPALGPFFADYHVLDSEGPHAAGAETWMLPAWPAIRIILTDRPISLRLGRRSYDPLPVASLYGTTSRAMRMTTHGGVTVGIGVKPLGWARFLAAKADLFRDQVVPLSRVMEPALVDELVETLRASDQGPGVKPLLDAFFERLCGPPCPDEPLIRQLSALIADDETHDLATACERIGVPANVLRRLSARYFGFPPKTLLIRTRFIRSLLRMMAEGDELDYRLIAPTYFDASHFLRDADRFLGMTPKRFARIDNHYLKAILRARMVVARAAKVNGR
jgi:hypothetical protein